MRERLLEFLRCPDCKKEFNLEAFESADGEISAGILHCANEHFFRLRAEFRECCRVL